MKRIVFLMIACLVATRTGASGEDAPARSTWTRPIRFSVPESSAPMRNPAPTGNTRPATKPAVAPHAAPTTQAAPPAAAETVVVFPQAARAEPEDQVRYSPEETGPIRFELGLRSMGAWLTDDRKGRPFDGSFIGSIYKLRAKQNWLPIHPYAQVKFALPCNLWLGAGATYSHLEVETLDDGGGDGDIESDLLLAYAVLEYPVERLRPYAEAGAGRAFNTFDADSSWSSGGRREFVLEDSPAWMLGGGLGVALTDRFTLDVHLRYVHFDVDGTYVFRGDSRPDTDFTFTPSYVAAGIGASYAL